MRLLLLLLRTSRWDAIIGIIAGAAVGLSASGFAWVMQAVVAHRGEHGGTYALIFTGCWLTYGLGSVLAGNRLSRVAQRAVRELRLSISRQIVEGLRGRISAENIRDASGAVTGARFMVLLPAA